ncbi:hypothetical protein ACHQM5_006166 [Ranunculus cassubicifolius]
MCNVGVTQISQSTITPQGVLREHLCHLTPWDLHLLSLEYIQTGLLYQKPRNISTQALLDKLKHSLSLTLTHFFPLTGRFVTQNTTKQPSSSIFLDCKDGPGADFVYSVADATISDILSPAYVPPLVGSLFALDRPLSHDGHNLPCLAVQVTELVDGVFIGCSFNHAVADGSSFWHFFNTWSEISRSIEQNMNIPCISRPPVTKRWSSDDQDPVINLPYSHPNEFIERYNPEPYRERIFHITSQSIAKLKTKANAELGTTKISPFQALSAHVWRSVTRARGLLGDETTRILFPMDVRSRIKPPLPTEFGNMKVRSSLETIAKFPIQLGQVASMPTVAFGGSHRFDVYTNDFGWGKPVAVRSGYGLFFFYQAKQEFH